MIHRETITVAGHDIETIVRGEGPRTIVFFHGFPDNMETFSPLFDGWKAPGYRLVSIPLPGYDGEELGKTFTVAELTRAMAARVQASSSDRVLVVGHDWGGIGAWCLAAHVPEALVGVVAMSVPPLWRYIANSIRTPSQLIRARYVFGFQVPLLPELRIFDGDYVRELWRRWSNRPVPRDHVERVVGDLRRRPSSPLAYYRGLRAIAHDDELRKYLRRRPGVPALGIHGIQDGCVAPGLWSGVGQWTDSETRLVPLSGVGHFPQWEATDIARREISRFADERFGAYNHRSELHYIT